MTPVRRSIAVGCQTWTMAKSHNDPLNPKRSSNGGVTQNEAVSARPSGRQILTVILGVLVVVFIASNSQSIEVSMLTFSVNLPLWVVLALLAVVSALIGMMLGSRRAKEKLARK